MTDMVHRIKQIQELNEQIVEARKAGKHDLLQRLRDEVQELLSQSTVTWQTLTGKSKPSNQKSEAKKRQIHKQRLEQIQELQILPNPAEDVQEKPKPQNDALARMKQLHQLNLKIVEARKKGDFDLMKNLQSQVKLLLQMD